MRHFDGNRYRTGIPSSHFQKPIDTLLDAGTAMLDLLFADPFPFLIHRTDLITVRCPIDSHVTPELLSCHTTLLSNFYAQPM